MFMAASYAGHKLCRRGDLVVNTMWAWMGALGVSQYAGIVSPSYAVYRPYSKDLLLPSYADQLFRTPRYISEYVRRSTGVQDSRLRLYPERLLDLPVVRPPADDQQSVVAYMAALNRFVSRYIRGKQKLIALLNDQKQAIIHHAVTRGLDPNVRLKPSGVEWLGDVPEHWERWRVGHLARVGNGSTPSRSNPSYWRAGTYPWLNSSCVNQNPVAQANQFVTPVALRECHLPIVKPGSVLVAITGQGKTRGTAALTNFEATINQHIAYLTPDHRRVSGEYLQLVLTGAYRELRRRSEDSGSTKGALTCWDLSHFRIALPDTAEQQRSLASVREATKGIETALQSTNSETALLREYRTRLIADVVTGKLDVRETAARLPLDEGGDAEAFVADEGLDDGAEEAGAEEEPEVRLAEGSA